MMECLESRDITCLNGVNPNLCFLFLTENERWVILLGGTRSGKTWSTLTYLLYKAITGEYVISVVGLNYPHLRRGALRDFQNLLKIHRIPHEENKASMTYRIGKSLIEFFSADNEGKLRGAQRNILFLNEGVLLRREAIEQLAMRTSHRIILDSNPTNQIFFEELIKDKNITKNCILRTTYKDNPHLTEEQIQEIESLQGFWRKVYAEGVFGGEDLAFYSFRPIHREHYDEKRKLAKIIVWGIDIGMGKSPTAITEVFTVEGEWYARQIYYGYENLDAVADILKTADKRTACVGDAANVDALKFFANKGVRVASGHKLELKTSYAILNSVKWHIAEDSKDLLKEAYNLRIKDTKLFSTTGADHAIDALRYAASALMVGV